MATNSPRVNLKFSLFNFHFAFTRIRPVIKKEFIHISRDFRTLVIVILMPVLMLFLYGFAINMEIQNIKMIVLDHSKSANSREMIQGFEGNGFFIVSNFSGSETDIEAVFKNRSADMALIIPHDFAQTFYREVRSEVQVIIDASSPNKALSIQNYVNAIFRSYNARYGGKSIIDVQPTIWYNPSLKSAYFFVPGLAALILIMISSLLTSVAIVREKETGTMEQILVSPIRPIEIIIGKVIPYIVLALVDLSIILGIAHFVFHVPFIGSFIFLILTTLVFIFVALSLGLFISTRAQTQQVAMMGALVATLLPTVMLSGFMFPLSSLPKILQIISHIVPARYFLVIIRGIMLKGNSVGQLWPEILILGCFGLLLVIISAKRFSTNLEG